MSEENLKKLCDLVTEAHTKIQKDFKNIDPVVGVNQRMRKAGIPVDVMTIDCLKSGKRIIIVLHDELPDIVRYQFSFKDQDPSDEFESLSASELELQVVYGWIKGYFSTVSN